MSASHHLYCSLLCCGLLLLSAQAPGAEEWHCEAVERAPHDRGTFTQGLEIQDGWLYESSGHYGRSFITRYRVSDNSEPLKQALPNRVFAEGLTLVGDKVYLLSWRAGTAWVLDADTLAHRETHHYSGEGWGLAYDDQQLIVSDGSHYLRFFDPDGFQLTETRKVTLDGEPLDRLNELEYANGLLWANRWYSNQLYAIEPATGRVVATVDCSELRQDAGITDREAVLNGIAHDPERQGLWVTGKYWPYRYLIRLPGPPEAP